MNLALTFHIWALDGHFYSSLAVIASREQKGVGGAEKGVSLAPRAHRQSAAPRGMDTGDGFSCSSQTPPLLPPPKFAVGQTSSGHGVTLRGKTSIQTELASLEQFSGLALPPRRRRSFTTSEMGLRTRGAKCASWGVFSHLTLNGEGSGHSI